MRRFARTILSSGVLNITHILVLIHLMLCELAKISNKICINGENLTFDAYDSHRTLRHSVHIIHCVEGLEDDES